MIEKKTSIYQYRENSAEAVLRENVNNNQRLHQKHRKISNMRLIAMPQGAIKIKSKKQ